MARRIATTARAQHTDHPAGAEFQLDIVSYGRRGPGRPPAGRPTDPTARGSGGGRDVVKDKARGPAGLSSKAFASPRPTRPSPLPSSSSPPRPTGQGDDRRPASPIGSGSRGSGGGNGRTSGRSGGGGGGTGPTPRLDPQQIAQVRRTVARVPEVMIKVSGGARDTEGAKAGLAYIDRQGRLPVEIDDGVVLQGRGVGDHLVADWQLDLCRSQYRRVPGEGETDTRDKLVHNLVLSMPAGTPGDAVLDAARGFARQNFASHHRYAMVLHTDQDHPHVHLVVKCEHETEGDQRLHIRKATLREWREQFAALMRDQGVEANATPRQVRGQEKGTRSSAVHHLLLADRVGGEGDSEVTSEVKPAQTTPAEAVPPARGSGAATSVRRKVLAVARELQGGRLSLEAGKATLSATRRQVEAGWAATAEMLRRQGQEALAAEVEQFTRAMAPVRTDRERIAAGLLEALQVRRTSEREGDPQDRMQERSR